jgi:hypothetical protein
MSLGAHRPARMDLVQQFLLMTLSECVGILSWIVGHPEAIQVDGLSPYHRYGSDRLFAPMAAHSLATPDLDFSTPHRHRKPFAAPVGVRAWRPGFLPFRSTWSETASGSGMFEHMVTCARILLPVSREPQPQPHFIRPPVVVRAGFRAPNPLG